MNTPNLASNRSLPPLLALALILTLLLCMAKLGHRQQQEWNLPDWDLPYAGCSQWCS